MLILEGKPAANSVAFTPDGTRLLVAWGSGFVDVWALPAGERVRSLGPFGRSTPMLAVHPSGRFMFVATGQPLVAVSLADGHIESDEFAPDLAFGVIASPNGNWVVVSDPT